MVFEHPVIPFGDFRIHVISHPAALSASFKKRLERHLLPVTRDGFGKVREPTPHEIQERVTDPSVSLLTYVDEISGMKGNETPRLVGYFSTKNLLGNTVHLLASVISKEDQHLAWYPLCKRIAMALGPAQLRLEGGQPMFYTAQSAYPYIHRDLLADGMMPAQLHEQKSGLTTHLAQVADQLGPHEGFDVHTSIRRGAFEFDAHEGKTSHQVRQLIEDETAKMANPKLAKKYRDLLETLGPNDALMAIRRYGRTDQRRREEMAELVQNEDTHRQIWTELLLGNHRRDIQQVNVDFNASHHGGLPLGVPVVSIQFKPGRWELDHFLQAWLENRTQDPARFGTKGTHRGQIQISTDGIRAPLDSIGLRIIHLALSATRTAQRQAVKTP